MRSSFWILAALVAAAPAAAAQSRPPADSLMGPGISHELARHRARQISNVRYALDLSLLDPDTARGNVTIRFTTNRPDDVILDFRGPRLSAVRVNGAAAPTTFNGAHLRIPSAKIRAGENVLTATFAALIAPAGASIIKFHDDRDGATYLYTLLVPSDANALFPCFDQPDLKAQLTLTLEVPRAWRALANGITEQITAVGVKATTYRFRQTEPLPTYLFAFAAGPWKSFTGGPRHTTLWVRASRAKEVEVDSLQDEVGSALASLSKYFGVPYPFQQFQYLLAPAFPFGGMEHPGVTMFNENSFIYREPPTRTQRLGRRATIYHEVAHQWFGDEVTMRWFDDLWLKEGFATYMAAKMQDIERLPGPWMSFYLRNKPAAYDVDQTSGTTPVWQQLANLDQAKSNYGAIVYNKAPGILKQLNYLVGDTAFRAGLHNFLVAHRYGNATWQDLLASIGQAAHRSLTDWGRQYILRPGMPILEQHVDIRNGRIARLTLTQHPAQPLSGAGVWPIRTQLVLYSHGQGVTLPIEISAETTVVAAAAGREAPDFVFANANDDAYGLVMLDPASTTWLESHIGSVSDNFLRAMLWGAMWDLVRDARLPPGAFITTAIHALPAERDEQIAGGIVSRMTRAASTYLSESQQELTLPRIEQVLLAGASDPNASYGLRKSQLDAYIGVSRSAAAIARLRSWLDSSRAAGMPLRQPTRWSIITHLVERGAPGAVQLAAHEEARDTSANGHRSAFIARAGVPDPDTKRQYFDHYFHDRALNEDWVTASLRSFNAPDQDALTLPYLRPALDSLAWIQRNRRIFFLGSWLGSFIGGQRSPAALRVIDSYLASRPDLPRDLREKILQTRDDLERTVKIRQTYAGATSANVLRSP
jgi:aminopeptidase N